MKREVGWMEAAVAIQMKMMMNDGCRRGKRPLLF